MEYPKFEEYDSGLSPAESEKLKTFDKVIYVDFGGGDVPLYLIEDNTIDLGEDIFDSWVSGEKKYALIYDSVMTKNNKLPRFLLVSEALDLLSKTENLNVDPEEGPDDYLFFNGAINSSKKLGEFCDGWIFIYSYDRENKKFRFGLYAVDDNIDLNSKSCFIDGVEMTPEERFGKEECQKIKKAQDDAWEAFISQPALAGLNLKRPC